MSVKVSQGASLYSLTSPPDHPDPFPASEWIAETVAYADREILVTVPFPDTIELVANVLNEHLASPYETGGVAEIYTAIDNDLHQQLKAMKLDGETLSQLKPTVKLGPNAAATFRLKYDDANNLNVADLTLRRSPQPELGYGTWSIRLEFSPSKVGPAGLVKLTAWFDDVLPFTFAKVVKDWRVARIDAAIDLIGAFPIDLIAQVKSPGKRLVYVGESGLPETVYLYERKKPLTKPPASISYNTLGTLRLKLYERRDYCQQLMMPTPYGDCPVTRVEILQGWRKSRPKLADLADIKNLLQERRVTYAAALGMNDKSPKRWLNFCLAAFGAGVAAAQQKHSIAQGLKFRGRYTDCIGDLVFDSRWEHWGRGLKLTGLAGWIAEAKSQ